MTYYNTTHIDGDDLEKAIEDTRTQEERILFFFKTTHGPWSPSQVLRYADLKKNTPITSVRRAMTNLTDEGKLVKTMAKVKGVYGKPEYAWRLKREGPHQAEMFV